MLVAERGDRARSRRCWPGRRPDPAGWPALQRIGAVGRARLGGSRARSRADRRAARRDGGRGTLPEQRVTSEPSSRSSGRVPCRAARRSAARATRAKRRMRVAPSRSLLHRRRVRDAEEARRVERLARRHRDARLRRAAPARTRADVRMPSGDSSVADVREQIERARRLHAPDAGIRREPGVHAVAARAVLVEHRRDRRPASRSAPRAPPSA